jgi:hypothetical protein
LQRLCDRRLCIRQSADCAGDRVKARAPFAHLGIRCAARERTCNDDGKSEVRKSGKCEMFLDSAKKGKSRDGLVHLEPAGGYSAEQLAASLRLLTNPRLSGRESLTLRQ